MVSLRKGRQIFQHRVLFLCDVSIYQVENIFVHDDSYIQYFPQALDTSTSFHTCSEIWTSTIYYLDVVSKICWMNGKQGTPWWDVTFCSVASPLGLHILFKPICSNTYGKYGIYNPNVKQNYSRWHLEIFFLLFFRDNKARQTDHMNCLWKIIKRKKKFIILFDVFLIGTLRVNAPFKYRK